VSEGIVCLDYRENIALIDVVWDKAPPTGARIGRSISRSTAFEVRRTGQPLEPTVDATICGEPSGMGGLLCIQGRSKVAVDADDLARAMMIDRDGRVIGIITGISITVVPNPTGRVASKQYRFVRCEVLVGLVPGTLIRWKDFGPTLKNAQCADESFSW